jgi:hypothetical protein
MNTTNLTGNDVDVVAAVDAAMAGAVASVAPQAAAQALQWANPEEYRQATGKRFRMTKEERTQHGETPEGRQAAFVARAQAGSL